MSQIILSAKATRDLKKQREYLSKFNEEAAVKAAETIMAAVHALASHPQLGKPLEDSPEYRELIRPFGAGSYTIRYRMDSERIIVVGIRHSKEKGLCHAS